MKKSFEKLTGLKELQKTLRFKLIPHPKTQEFLDEAIEADRKRAEAYPLVKKMIDDGYRECIESCYEGLELDYQKLEKAIEGKDEKETSKVRLEYYNNLHEKITKSENFKNLEQSNFLKTLLEKEEISEEEREALIRFMKFTTYFLQYQENRSNIFKVEEITTSLYYRIINDNFTRFLNNKRMVLKISKEFPKIISEAEHELKEAGIIPIDSGLVKDYFQTNSYNKFLVQKGIDLYNKILGGDVIDGRKVQGLNEKINLFKQQNKSVRSIKTLNQLDKQILSESKTVLIDSIENNQDLYNRINELVERYVKYDIVGNVEQMLSTFDEADLGKVYISSEELNLLSVKIFKDYSIILQKIKEHLESNKIEEKGGKKLSKKELEHLDKSIGIYDEKVINKKPKTISLELVLKSMENSTSKIEVDDKKYENIIEYFRFLMSEHLAEYTNALDKIKEMLREINPQNIRNIENVDIIKEYLDSVQNIKRAVSSFSNKNESDYDGNFYGIYFNLMMEFEVGNKMLNLVRNYVTKAIYSNEKIKIKFDIPTLGSGWTKSKETDNKTVILRKDGKYFLAIIKSKFKFDNIRSGKSNYEKMEYYLFPVVNQMLPKCIFTKEVKNHFDKSDDEYRLYDDKFCMPFIVTKELYDAYNKKFDGVKKFQKEYLKKNPKKFDEYKRNLETAISGCKDFMGKYKTTSVFDISSLKNTEEYVDIQEFYKELKELTYEIEFRDIDDKKIEELVDRGELLLFQIYNKDFAERKTGRDNLHTMYFKELFSRENLEKKIFRLAGNAELFFRKKSIENAIVHKKGQKIINKTYEDNGVTKSIPDRIVLEINTALENNKIEELSDESKEYYKKATVIELNYDIVKDRRYTADHFEFHVPIKINAGKDENIDVEVKSYLKENKVNIIGIDRGERNLIYISVIDTEGKIIEQKSLNIINGIDYNNKLSITQRERQEQRKSWKTINNIKNIKEGYVSTAVHEIIKLVIEYNAVIVMENLNYGFKNTRKKVERQIYQKFENMLVNKLSYLVFKDKPATDIGGTLVGYQLADQVKVKDEIMSNGIILYVPASYTSKIDPTTGFVNLIPFSKITSFEERIKFMEKLDSVRYYKNLDMFGYSFNYSNFENVGEVAKSEWTVYTNDKRVFYKRNNAGQGKYIEVNLTDELKALLKEEKIEYEKEQELKNVIINNRVLVNKFFETMKLAANMRYSNENEDYIISPILKDGKFFKSTKEMKDLPCDADANGAYNIALKGMLILDRFRKSESQRIDTFISKYDWLKYMQEK